jgi:hypothetical protein
MTVPTYYIAKSDKVTHSRTITVENLIELFKEKVGAPESAQVLFNYSMGDLKRKIEIIWTEDASKKTLDFATEPTYGGHPAETPFEEWRSKHPCAPPTITIPVATYNVQVGDLVMVRDDNNESWFGPEMLYQIKICSDRLNYFITGDKINGYNWRCARHLTDEERAQIKRI